MAKYAKKHIFGEKTQGFCKKSIHYLKNCLSLRHLIANIQDHSFVFTI